MYQILNLISDVRNKFPNQFNIATIAAIAFLLSTGLMLYSAAKSAKAVNQFREEAIKLQVKVDTLEAHLGHRFSYFTADMDAAKTQIRELVKNVDRLNSNGLKLINYLENRNTGKNASARR